MSDIFAISFRARDRIAVNSWLVIASFLAVLLLSSQSAASLVTYALCVAMLWRLRDWDDVFRCNFVWPLLTVLAYLPLTALWSEQFTLRELGSQLVRSLLTFTFVVAIAECQLRGEIQSGLARALGLVGSLVAVVCIGLYLWEAPWDGRLNGLGQLDTHVVAALVFGCTLVMVLHALVFGSAGRWRVIGFACVVPLALAVWLSDSRNAWVSVSFGVTVLVLAHFSRNARQFLLAVVMLTMIAGGAIAAVLYQPELAAALLPRGDSFRALIWNETLARLAEHPWFGLGILTSDDVASGGIVFQHPHNMYLSIAFQGGLVGLLLFVWLLGRTLRELLKRFRQPDAKLALGILAVALPSYLLDGHELLDKVGDTWFLFWLPVALALGLRWHRALRSSG